MRDYDLIKQHMGHLQQVAETERLLQGTDRKTITSKWGRRLRTMMSSDNMAKDTRSVPRLTPRHNI